MSTELQIKKDYVYNLPIELVKYILAFSPIVTPSSKCIKRLMAVYDEDHCWDLTKQYRMYYVKNILSFSEYYMDTLCNGDEYMLGHRSYNKFEKDEDAM